MKSKVNFITAYGKILKPAVKPVILRHTHHLDAAVKKASILKNRFYTMGITNKYK